MNEVRLGQDGRRAGRRPRLRPAQNVDEADLILFNTCSVREKAQEKSLQRPGPHQHLKARGVKIGVGGLRGQPGRRRIIKRALMWTWCFGPQTLHRLPEMLNQREQVDSPRWTSASQRLRSSTTCRPPRRGGLSLVSIMEGCSKYCSYCVVPTPRGEEVSRPLTMCWWKWRAWPTRA